MPIKKRGGGFVKLARPEKPKPKKRKTAKKSGKLAKPPITRDVKEPKVKSTSNLKKRKPLQSEFVYWDGDELVVRTPKECTRWPADFRMRIIPEYVAPKTTKPGQLFRDRYIDTGYQKLIYRVQGHDLMVKQPFELLSNSTNVVVLRTDIHDLTTDRKLFLCHDNPAMRVLMVYEFLHGKEIGGVPRLTIASRDTKW